MNQTSRGKVEDKVIAPGTYYYRIRADGSAQWSKTGKTVIKKPIKYKTLRFGLWWKIKMKLKGLL